VELLPHHRELIEASAISPDVAEARGYQSVTDKRELEGKFGPVQRRVPGLLTPLHNVYGELHSYQLRPDEPRLIDGRVVKYETPRGLKMMLDCPPSTLEHIRNPKVQLWVTEGARKVDALASVGLRAIGLLGVDSWRGTNGDGGKTVLEDWHGVALNGRRIVVCFDSDAFEKPAVHGATERLGRWLESRGAELAFTYLPHRSDGTKQGVDDFLAEHSREELLARVETEWHPLPHQTVRQESTFDDAPLRPTAELLERVRDVLSRYVILPSSAARLAIALYVLHTWAFDGAHCTPYLVIQSAAKRSGKTRLEELLEQLVRSPWRIAAASEAAMFRKIETQRPTLLLDEVDAIFGAKAEGTEAVRGILNAGNRPGAAVARVVGEGANLEPVDFSVYCPKVLAGIVTERWPDTVVDRSISIRLERKKADESVQRLRVRKLEAETAHLRAELGRWASEHVEELLEAEPELPAALDDRAAEGWEAMLAIAELAERESGDAWAERARRAAVKLAEGRVEEDAHGLVALRAIRAIFGEAEELHTSTILEELSDDEELPFGDYRKGKGLSGRGLTRLLKPFAITSQNVRVDGNQAKGYKREQFADSWARYCPDPAQDDSNPSQRPNPNGSKGFERYGYEIREAAENASVPPQTPTPAGDGTVGRIETVPEGPGTQNGASEHSVEELSDDELAAIFPGAAIDELELESPVAPCGCRSRLREWRLRGEAVDVEYTYVSGKAYTEAVGKGLDVIPKGKRSGWTYGTTPLGLGHQWMCATCHPPAAGLDVEYRDVA